MSLPASGVRLSAEDADQAIRAVERFLGVVGQIGGKAETEARKTKGASSILTGAFERIGHSAIDMAANAAGALVDLGKDTIAVAGDFEAGMNQFTGVVGQGLRESGKDIDDFSNLFLKLGADTQFSAAQAQEAAINLAKGGRSAAQVYAELPAVLNLAAAGQLDLAQSADIAAKQLGIWGNTGVTAAQVADSLASAANASTVDVGELALGLANVGGIAKTAGLSFEDTVQTLALLAPGFSSAADAGTSFKVFLTRLQPTTADATAAMRELGLLTAEGKSKFYDATGSFIGMEKAAGLLEGSLKGLSQAQKVASLQAIFGQDAFRAAALLGERGAKGFTDMGLAMEATGGAAQQAAARQKGFNFALESLKGSAETLQIVLGSKFLPLLTAIIQRALIPGVNAITDWAQGLGDVSGPAITAAENIYSLTTAIAEGFVPAITIAGTVTTVYALTQIPYLGVGLVLLAQRLAATTAAFWAQGAATAGAALPIALIVAAIAGIALAYSNLQDKIRSANEELLNSRQWWTDSAKALDDYSTSSAQMDDRATAAANTVKALREQIQRETEDLGRRRLEGTLTDAQMQTELATINRHADALKIATDNLNTQIGAQLRQEAASKTGTEALAGLNDGQQQVAQQAQLTAEELEKLGKQLEKTYSDGRNAVESYVNTEVEFIQQLNQARQGGFDEQERQAIASYAKQQAAQRAHLGQMLTDYTLTQVQLGNITTEQGQRIVGEIERQFGVQQDLSARTFLQMTSDIDAFARGAGGSLDQLGANLSGAADDAVETRIKMDELARTYEAELLSNFEAKKIEADELRRALQDIPARVYSEVVLKTTRIEETVRTDSGGARPGDAVGARALGGPVLAGLPYIVGERGPELVIPEANGYVLTAADTRSLLAGLQQFATQPQVAPPALVQAQPSAAQISQGAVGTASQSVTNNYYYQLPQVPQATGQAGADMERRVRMLEMMRRRA